MRRSTVLSLPFQQGFPEIGKTFEREKFGQKWRQNIQQNDIKENENLLHVSLLS
jgi:hypothetical protein